MAPPPFKEVDLPADTPLVRELAAQPNLVPFEIATDLPFWRDEDVRRVRPRGGHSCRPCSSHGAPRVHRRRSLRPPPLPAQTMGALGYGFFSSYKKMTCRMFWDDAARRLEAAALFGPLCEGPISQVHGARASQGSAGGAGAAV